MLFELWKLLTCQSCHVKSEKACSTYHLLLKIHISPNSSTRSKENLESCSCLRRVRFTGASIESTLKADFSPCILFDFFLLEIQEIKVNLQKEGKN